MTDKTKAMAPPADDDREPTQQIRSTTLFNLEVENTEKTVIDPAATLAMPGGEPRAPNDPRRVLDPKAAAQNVVLQPGYRLFEYRIDSVLGQGGFGIAYAATDVNLASKVVIKEYLPEEFAYRTLDSTVQARDDLDQEFYQSGLDSFLVEARTLATFRHRNIVRVARFFEANKTAYMVLEYERGQSLKAFRKEHEDLAETTLVSLLAPLMDGLAVVHSSGYLHRDIKPDNIYVRDEDGSLVLLDFGAARQTAVEKAEIGVVVTPGYGPIEQYAGGGRQGPWTDIYALGATLFWVVTGKKPLDAPGRLNDPDGMPSAESLGKGRYSVEFLRAIDWALKMHPNDRPQSISQFRSALFASHAGVLGLQEALRKTEDTPTASEEAVRASFVGRLRTFGRLMKRPASWPIVLKMTLAMVATALAPMLITALFNLNSTQGYVEEMELRNLEQIAQTTSGRISQLISAKRSLADYLGTDDDFVGYLGHPTPDVTKAIVAKLDGLMKADPDLQFVMVMDRAGNALAASDKDVMGKNFKFREYFKQAMEGRSYMTGIIVGSVAGAAGVFFSRPVFAADGKTPLGAVVMRMKAEAIGRILANSRLANDRLPFLVDGDGVVVWHPDERLMYKSLVPLPKKVVDEIVADQRFRREKIESLDEPVLADAIMHARDQGHVSYRSTVSHRDEIAGYAPIPGNDWVVGVSESREYFAAPINQLFRKVVVSVLAAGAIFVALAVIFARSIVRPIERLTGAAEQLKIGNYDGAHVEVKSGDEIGQLARTFNVMIDVLRQREREREGHGASLGFDKKE